MYVMRVNALYNEFQVVKTVKSNTVKHIVYIPNELVEAGVVNEGYMNFDQFTDEKGDERYRLEFRKTDTGADEKTIGWLTPHKVELDATECAIDYYYIPEEKTIEKLTMDEKESLANFVYALRDMPRERL